MTGLRLGILRADYATCKYVDDFSILHFETHQLTSYDHDSHDELREIEERYRERFCRFNVFRSLNKDTCSRESAAHSPRWSRKGSVEQCPLQCVWKQRSDVEWIVNEML